MSPLPQAPRDIDPVKLVAVDGVLSLQSEEGQIAAYDAFLVHGLQAFQPPGRGRYVWEPQRQRWRWTPYAKVG